jgi:ubiquinone/menaquinone biosynthesis C-methylase UbiE
MATHERSYYEQEWLWGNEPTPYQIEVREDIIDVLPRDVSSILDVGCGDGFITNALPKNLFVVGLDISLAALQHVSQQKIIGSITCLPFSYQSFDLVMVNDTIEHLSNSEYQLAIEELFRVSYKYILVTVPFMENLKASFTICANCGNTFQINHHHRAFGIHNLLGLFEKHAIPQAVYFTGGEISSVELAQNSIRSSFSPSVSWKKALCPYCGATRSATLIKDEHLDALYEATWGFEDYSLKNDRPNRRECIVLFKKIDTINIEEHSLEIDSENVAKICLRSNLNDGKQYECSIEIRDEARQLVMISDDILPQDDVRYWLSYNYKGINFNLAHPERIGDNGFIIPLWFTPESILQLSPTDDFEHDQAITNLFKLNNYYGKNLRLFEKSVQALRESDVEIINNLTSIKETVVVNQDLEQVRQEFSRKIEEYENVFEELNKFSLKVDNIVEELSKLFEKNQIINQELVKWSNKFINIENNQKDIMHQLEGLISNNLNIERRLRLIKTYTIFSALGWLFLLIMILFLLIRV